MSPLLPEASSSMSPLLPAASFLVSRVLVHIIKKNSGVITLWPEASIIAHWTIVGTPRALLL